MVYVEVTLLPSSEITQQFLMSKVFKTIHLQLIQLKDNNGSVGIGLSFPEYSLGSRTLGNKIRLISANRDLLETFDPKRTLNKYTDYVHISRIRGVPDSISSYVAYARVQPTTSRERFARRKAKFLGISYEEALEMIPKNQNSQITLPYVIMTSSSTKKRFSLFISEKQVVNCKDFIFNTYGLSIGGGIPSF